MDFKPKENIPTKFLSPEEVRQQLAPFVADQNKYAFLRLFKDNKRVVIAVQIKSVGDFTGGGLWIEFGNVNNDIAQERKGQLSVYKGPTNGIVVSKYGYMVESIEDAGVIEDHNEGESNQEGSQTFRQMIQNNLREKKDLEEKLRKKSGDDKLKLR